MYADDLHKPIPLEQIIEIKTNRDSKDCINNSHFDPKINLFESLEP